METNLARYMSMRTSRAHSQFVTHSALAFWVQPKHIRIHTRQRHKVVNMTAIGLPGCVQHGVETLKDGASSLQGKGGVCVCVLCEMGCNHMWCFCFAFGYYYTRKIRV